jgi:microcystin-dependent protein
MTSSLRSIFTLSAHQKNTVGDTKTSVIGNDHLGWLKCDGRSVSKSQFYLLWRVIGYSFGGSGNSFNLPDARGMVPGIVGTGTDISGNTQTFVLGEKVGEYIHTLTEPEMPIHNHTGLTDLSGAHIHTSNATGTSPGYGLIYRDGNNTINAAMNATPTEPSLTATPAALTINSAGVHAHGIQNSGGSLPHNNVQPTLPIGNLFMYSGLSSYPTAGYPYTSGTEIL